MSGLTSYHAGLAAEAQVARHYRDQGYRITNQRWRGAGGEIDLIVQGDDGFVFVEVKKSRSHAAAAFRLLPRQIQRLYAAASEFLGTKPSGLNTPSRFDVALVDKLGRVEIIANALCV